MPKYVCDFDTVRSVADKLIDTASKLENDSTNYYSNMNSSLSGWSSSSKNNFVMQCDNKSKEAIEHARDASELGEHIKNTVSKIEELESELAAQDI